MLNSTVSYGHKVLSAPPETRGKIITSPFGTWWLLGALAIMFSGRFVLHFNHTTRLAPIHHDDLATCVAAALAVGLFSAVIAMTEPAQGLKTRIAFAVFGAVVGAMAGAMAAGQALRIAHDVVDFPKGNTTASWSEWPVERAYETHVRSIGRQYVATAHGTFGIYFGDFQRMWLRRGTGVDVLGRREVIDTGGFCVRVPVQTSGDAVRVMLGPMDELPKDSVIPCGQPGG